MDKKNKIDPYAAREAEKYENPIPSREFILDILENASGPLTLKHLIKALEIRDDNAREALRRRMIAMVRDGQILSTRRGAFGKVDKMALVKGVVQGHRDGFGFVIPTDGSEDIYLCSRQMRKVFNGDEVLVRPGELDYRGRREGAIVEVLAHNTRQLAGRFLEDGGFFFVRPENPRVAQDIMVPKEEVGEAKDGQLVVIDIFQQPDRKQRPLGRVVEILGEHLAPGMEIDVAIRSHGIPHEWPEALLDETKNLTGEVVEEDKLERIDLRHLPFVTIDGEDARDFDDAVFCEKKRSGGWRLFVAIADVSHYVKPNTALDGEARARGNSVYFPDFVVPMLPEILSNGLCSLNPNVDRLCMVCEMTISAAGRISGYQFYEAVMHSHARMTYTQVGKIIEERDKKRSGIRQEFNDLLPQFDQLYELYQALKSQRSLRGAIDFETAETRIQFDENRKISRIVPVVRNDAHKLIEECMLAANVCAAKFLEFHQITSLYRVHDSPKEEKLENLYAFLAELGLGFSGGEISPQDYRDVLAQIKDRPDAHIIQTVMLRSMNQAVYQPDNLGHFGLAYKSYTHFTSPIRRYPDLMVHRAIRAMVHSDRETRKVKRHPDLQLQPFTKLYGFSDVEMAVIGEQSSMTERRADDATRDVVAWLKCEFLQQRIGEEFQGVISAVTNFGLFVELKDLYVEGLVHITSLPQDYYVYDAPKHRLVGERNGQVFRLGDELNVQVVRVDLEERKVDFELVGVVKPRAKRRKKTKTSPKAEAMAKDFSEKNEGEKSAKDGERKVRKRAVSTPAEKVKPKKKTKTSTKTSTKSKVKSKVKSTVKTKGKTKAETKAKTKVKPKTAKKSKKKNK